MRIALVVQRYGLEVSGGAELHARQLAEHLAPYVQVEVLTTCALDYMTWQNHYPPGYEKINDIPVRRFTIRNPRQVEEFNRFSLNVIDRHADYYDEIRWMAMQGPDSPDLFRYIDAHQEDYDLFLFLTYLYASTFVGLQLVPHKSILVPTSHDESTIRLNIFRTLFNLPRGLIFNTQEEESFIRAKFHNRHIPGIIAGVGIDIPTPPAIPTLDDEYILYLGRVDQSKGCVELFDYFLTYKAETGDPVKLVLVGSHAMPIPDHPDIIAKGFLPGTEHFAWLRDAQLMILPSPHESLSMVTLEAWALEVPVLLNGHAAPLRGHVHRAHGGLYYTHKDEFIESLRFLRNERELARQLGKQGKRYVVQHYRWDQITRKHVDFFKEMHQRINGRTQS